MKHVVIIDYGSGNLRSAAKSFEKVADQDNTRVIVSSDPKAFKDATHIVLPGVGAFADCMQGLTRVPGLLEALHASVHKDKTPFLGICVGMQLLATTGHEHGLHQGLGWIPGNVVPLSHAKEGLKIPHMGWNELHLHQPNHPLLNGLNENDHAYFVHSYHFEPVHADHVIASTEYGQTIASLLVKENIAATQFHPEKSQATGLRLLHNFLHWRPTW